MPSKDADDHIDSDDCAGGDARSSHTESDGESECSKISDSSVVSPDPPAAPAAPAPPAPIPPAPAIPPRPRLGLIDFDRAPSRRTAACGLCGSVIAAGVYRWQYLPMAPAGRRYHIHKFAHPGCIRSARFPAAMVAPSADYLQSLGPVHEQLECEAILCFLRARLADASIIGGAAASSA